ncbi:MAG: S8 family serine peptidase [Bdellovibrionaceae bacterium]|nr:S8 family serine peptidase [Pseudobdellovibrionaceae bacterium]
MFKVLALIFFILPHFCYALCPDPVPNQYIVVTSNPEKVLESQSSSFKTSTNQNQWIYNHLQKKASFKTNSSQNIPLKYSTLVLTMDNLGYKKIKNLSGTLSIEQDCYVYINNLDKPSNLDITNLDIRDEILNNDLEETPPNDPLLSEQMWYFDVTGSLTTSLDTQNKTLVAVSDTGFEYTHLDLINNLWVNDLEYNGRNNVDDDNNKCVDDIHGCDLTTSDGQIGPNNYRSNYLDHGTHVAGIIGAEQNNARGIYGVASNVELMLLKSFNSSRGTTSSDLMRSIYFAVDNGAKIINCSWGVNASPNVSEFLAFEYARKNDVLAVVAAGNENIFASRTSPAGLTNVLTVGSMNSQKEISTFSNYGDSVDIYAPGGDKIRRNEFIWSTVTANRYEGKRGTSMAAPFISGVLANIKSAYPQATRNELMNLLFQSAEKKSLKAYYEPTHLEDGRILNTYALYQLAKDYFNQEDRYYDFEPKDISKPIGSGSVNSNSVGDYKTSSSGCSRKNNSELMESTSVDAEKPLSIFLLLLPVFLVLVLKYRLKDK